MPKKRERALRGAAVWAVAVVSGLVAAGCGGDAASPSDGEPPPPLTVAGTYPATGGLREDGGRMEKGYRLAIEMLNEAGGIDGRKVRLILRDDGSDPRAAAEIYRELADTDSIDLLIGPYASSITDAVAPVVEAAGRPLVAGLASSSAIWEGKGRQWTVQMLNPARDNLAGAAIVAAQKGAETVAMAYEDSRFPVSAAEGVRAAVAQHGLRLVMDEKYPPGGADHAELSARARDLRADLFLGGGYTDDAIAFTRAAAEVGYAPMLMSWAAGPAEPSFPGRVGELARCMIGNTPWLPTLRTSGLLADNATFVRRFNETYGEPAGYTAAAGFGTVDLLAQAVNASVAATGEVRDAAIRDFLFRSDAETVLGPYGVVGLGDPGSGSQRRLVRLQIQWQEDGQGGLAQRVIYPLSMAEAEACVAG
ncbi:amino acid ABC transporter substrate-binding protein [Candidatus Palauibacter sp.]|uniref:amino acid ABC transporter substrate-binding protein n=1 Tax=Candidatus Palauibacter sp. TaxID=3101350 RepID=UPI003B0228F0